MKARRTTRTKLRSLEPSRQKLRDFSAFVETQDAELLAEVVTMIPETLASVAKIELFFKTYAQALRLRRPQ